MPPKEFSGSLSPDRHGAQVWFQRDDRIAFGSEGNATVLGLPAQVNITGVEPANDTLRINALNGDDVVEASGLTNTTVKLEARVTTSRSSNDDQI